jgi:hypothetical protein
MMNNILSRIVYNDIFLKLNWICLRRLFETEKENPMIQQLLTEFLFCFVSLLHIFFVHESHKGKSRITWQNENFLFL